MRASSRFRGIVAVGLLLTIVSAATAKYSGGAGEPNDPYQIATAADLIALGEDPNDYDKHFILTADIDLDPNLPGRKVFDRAVIGPDANDTEDGFQGVSFTGVFDGNGHTISHLTITGVSYLGLFGRLVSGADVKHLGVDNVDIFGSGDYIGGLAGSNESTINWCYTTGTVSGNERIGGLVGENGAQGRRGGSVYGTIVECYSCASVSGETSAGGLVGSNLAGSVSHCYSMGPVVGGDNAGGLVGYNGDTVTNCYSVGPVRGDGSLGGLVAENSGYVAVCLWDTQTSGLSGSAAGMGLTTTEMMDPEMLGLNDFANDPSWVLDAGRDYPRLTWEGTPGDIIAEPDTDWMDGLGTAEDPYRIDTAEQLILLGKASILWDRQFVLGADIDLDPNLPGRQVFGQAVISTFTGVFDGNGHTISHLTIEGGSYLGLFGQLGGWPAPAVRNLGVVDIRVTGTGDCVGGLVGYNRGGSVTQCYSSGLVSGSSRVGGLVGLESRAPSRRTITDSYSTAAVTATTEHAGGLVGLNEGTIVRCYSTGSVAAASGAGGLVGAHGYGVVTACFWDIETSGQATSAAGTGLTTAQMQVRGTFLEWGVCPPLSWTIDEGNDYPRLWWEMKAGQPLEIWLSEFLAGEGTPEYPYLIYTLEDVNMIARFPCEQDKHFKLMFIPGEGTPEDPYVIRAADDLSLLAQCPYEQDKHFRLGFVPGAGTPEDPYVIRTADDLSLLARCPYEQDKQFRLGFVAGKGTQEDPYLIDTADQVNLVGMCPYERSAHFMLMADIDLSDFDGKEGRPAIHVIDSFAGVFDGNGHTISHLTIQGGGLFGQLAAGAEVRDLGVVDVNVTGSSSYAGALAGRNEGSVTRCYSTGAVSGNEYVGGLIGENRGTVTQCYSSGTVSGSWSVGGLVGSNHDAVTCCYSTAAVTGAVTAGLSVGGLVGWDSGALTQCYSAGGVRGRDGYVGGLVGCGGWLAVQCFWDTQTSGQAQSIGLVGKTTAQMRTAGTFLDAGWDFVAETANGTDDIWWIDEGCDYPRLAWESCSPQDRAKGISRSQILRWKPGGPGMQDDVYFGDDEAAVASATSASSGVYCGRQPAETATCEPGELAWGKTYYWRIDTVDDADPGSVWKGRVWSFTITDVVVSHDPADGAIGVVQSPVLSWKPGGPGLQYDIYLGETVDSVAEATMASEGIYRGWQTSEMTTYTPLGLTRGKTYYWRIDAIDDADPGNVWKGSVLSFTVTDSCVTPDPPDGATDVTLSQVLSWTPGEPGLQYDVYLGETEDSVTNATMASEGIYRGRQASEATAYTPLDLVWGKTYYWRIDGVNGATSETTCKGQTWNFTVETYGYPIKPVKATASNSSNDKTGPEKTIDGSGLNALDQHSTSDWQMWLSGFGVPPVWIQYQFDRVYTLDRMWVWNSNWFIEPFLGFGARDVTVEYSLDGVAWTALGQVQFARATGTPTYTANTVVEFGGVQAQFVRLTITRNWGGLIPQCSLSEVRFFYMPLHAYAPQPAPGATGVALDAVLSWRPGREAIRHEVYLSTDREAVANGTALVQTVTIDSFDLAPLALEYGKTYYWKVNEVATASTWEGDVWSFSTRER